MDILAANWFTGSSNWLLPVRRAAFGNRRSRGRVSE